MKRLLTALLLTAALSTAAQTLRPDNIDGIISSMTLEEKIDLVIGAGTGWGNPDAKVPGTAGWTTAIPRLGIPSIFFADGPQGVNLDKTREYDTRDYSCTFFLSGSCLASSWDVEAAGQIGQAVGYELKERGLDVILGPGVNLQRSILCGRNQEYFAEDPILGGKLAAAWIRGAQSNGVATSLKHFAVNSQETNRKENDARVGARALRELYLKGFEIAVKEGRPLTVMGAYNYINGVHACENKGLLTDLLRDEWGFDGLVMSDWSGVASPVEAVKAGCDLVEPGTAEERDALLQAVSAGSLSEAAIDKTLRHILRVIVQCPSFHSYDYSEEIDRKAHQALLRRVAAESMVLLQNNRKALPLAPCRVALYGCASYDLIPANMGVNGVNHGVYHVSLVQGLREAGFSIYQPLLRQYTAYVPAAKQRVQSAFPEQYKLFYRFDQPEELIPGKEAPHAENPSPLASLTADLGVSRAADGHSTLEEQVLSNDAAIITIARSTGEAFDRSSDEFELSASEKELIATVSEAFHRTGKPVIVLLNVPAAIETASWRDSVDAVLLIGQPGERAGESIADALTGQTPPSGRLAQTWPISYGDALADRNFPDIKEWDLKSLIAPRQIKTENLTRNVDYTEYQEGIYVGYRYFTTAGVASAYPFGFGLGYSDFAYSDLSVRERGDSLFVSVNVENRGDMPGREVVQLYVHAPADGMDKPVRELKAFAKTRTLSPGESEAVEMKLSLYDLASFHTGKSQWRTAKGNYLFQVCASSAETILQTEIKLRQSTVWDVSPLMLPKSSFEEGIKYLKNN